MHLRVFRREDAKAFFWKRLNGEDDDEDEEGDEEEGAGDPPQVSATGETSTLLEIFPLLQGNVSSLCRCAVSDGSAPKCDACAICGDEPRPSLCKGLHSALLRCSCIPKEWLVRSFTALYAPMHIALDIPTPLGEAGTNGGVGRTKKSAVVAAYDDGLGEDPKPFEHLVGKVSWSPIRTDMFTTQDGVEGGGVDGVEQYCPDEPDGDDDAFKLICSVANALSRVSVPARNPSVPSGNERRSPGPRGGLIHVDSHADAGTDCQKEYNGTHVYVVPTLEELEVEIATALRLTGPDDVDEIIAGSLPGSGSAVSDAIQGLEAVTLTQQEEGGAVSPCPVQDEDVGSTSFIDAFSLVTSPRAHELTGVLFTWKIIGVDSFASFDTPSNIESADSIAYSKCRFRVTAALTSELQDAICDRSMHNSMHNESVCSDDDSTACSADEEKETADEDDDEDDDDEPQLRKVSRRLRARLLSLCGSIAYLLGDAMGGYK